MADLFDNDMKIKCGIGKYAYADIDNVSIKYQNNIIILSIYLSNTLIKRAISSKRKVFDLRTLQKIYINILSTKYQIKGKENGKLFTIN